MKSELEKYKALYENEKEHTKTLNTIINKLIEMIPGAPIQEVRELNDFFKPPYKFTCNTEGGFDE